MTRELARLAVPWPDLGCLAALGILGKMPNNTKSMAIPATPPNVDAVTNSGSFSPIDEAFRPSPPNVSDQLHQLDTFHCQVLPTQSKITGNPGPRTLHWVFSLCLKLIPSLYPAGAAPPEHQVIRVL